MAQLQGDVYRARDARLARDVALKVLPASFAEDPERLARFEREAQVLAALKHPNIGAIYGLESSQMWRPLRDARGQAGLRTGRRQRHARRGAARRA